MSKIRYSMLIVAIFLALVLSALNVAPALADESTPPEPAPTEEEAATPPAEGETDSAVESESPTVAEVIESLPEDTTLVVVDENGEALPLASEEAQEIIEVADPQWCPVGVTPGSASCSGIKTSFNGGTPANNLKAWLLANQSLIGKAGVIWIDEDYDSTTAGEGGEVVLDGLDYTTMDNFALTINGGWVGAGTALNVNNPSEFYVPFRIINWTGAVTINNIVVTGATGANSYALDVQTTGNVTLNNVDVTNNTTQYGGAYIETFGSTSNVIVNDSTFNENTQPVAVGLGIVSKGTVTLKNITANGNTAHGVGITNQLVTTPKAVTLNGTNHFNYNGLIGLTIETKGAITLNNITAMGNTNGSGVYLDNCEFDGVVCTYAVASGVTIKGTNNFSDNGYDGLRIFSGGAISISNITANNNGTDPGRDPAKDYTNTINLTYDNAYGKGVYLNNYGSFAQKNVTLSGVNTFNGNASNGLTAIVSGLLTVSNITANENGCDTTTPFEDGTYCAGAYLEAYMGITQTGYGRFSDNAEDGLTVGSFFKGAVTLNNLYADSNGRDGVVIGALGATGVNVTLNGANVFTNNADDGLEIDSDGVITLNNLTANYNNGFGVAVDNSYAATAKAVLIKGAAVFNENGFDGLEIFSNGAVTTNGLTATNNNGFGVYIDNCGDNAGVCTSPVVGAVTLNGNNFFDINGEDGLFIESRGAITVNNLTSTYSINGWGAYLNNYFNNAVGGVTIKGFANTSYNGDIGLQIFSTGAVTLANLTSDGNVSHGVEIDNAFDTAKPMNVTITGVNSTSANDDFGLIINTYGAVLINSLTANYNGDLANEDGVEITNSNGSMVRPVTLNGNNTFNSNAGDGLYIDSLGAIKVNNVMANDNGGYGAYLENGLASFSQPVTITGYGIFTGNSSTGLYVDTNGNATFANINANENGGGGAYIFAVNNLTLTTFANVIFTGVNTFNNNTGGDGLTVNTDGAITISNITANTNEYYGAYLDNLGNANGIKAITLSGTNMFNSNKEDGLYINASGNVTLTRITANNNNDLVGGAPQSAGVYVNSSFGNILLTCGSMYNNEGYGYDLNVAGIGKTITLKGVFTFGNPLGNDAPAAIITRTCPLP